MIAKIEFDLDCDDERELYGKVNAIIAPKEDDDDYEEIITDYEAAYDDLRATISDMLEVAKAGTSTSKVLTTLMERTEEIDEEQNIER